MALWKWQPETVLSFLTTGATVNVTTSEMKSTGRAIRKTGAIVTTELMWQSLCQQSLASIRVSGGDECRSICMHHNAYSSVNSCDNCAEHPDCDAGGICPMIAAAIRMHIRVEFRLLLK